MTEPGCRLRPAPRIPLPNVTPAGRRCPQHLPVPAAPRSPARRYIRKLPLNWGNDFAGHPGYFARSRMLDQRRLLSSRWRARRHRIWRLPQRVRAPERTVAAAAPDADDAETQAQEPLGRLAEHPRIGILVVPSSASWKAPARRTASRARTAMEVTAQPRTPDQGSGTGSRPPYAHRIGP